MTDDGQPSTINHQLSTSEPLSDREANQAVSLLGRLPVESEVRGLALRLIRGERLDSIEPLVAVLLESSHVRWREAEVAAWALGRAELGQEERDWAASALMDRVEAARRESLSSLARRLIPRILGIAALAYFIFLVVAEPQMRWVGDFFTGAVMATLFTSATSGPWYLWSERHQRDRVRAAAAHALGRLGITESVGALAGALRDRNPLVRDAAGTSLRRLMPMLTEAHYGELGAESMAHLGRALTHPDTQLVAMVLQVLSNVGTSHALPYVERLALRGRTVRLREAAAAVAAVLRERKGRESAGDRLLRAAMPAANPSEALLRPAGQGETDTNRLLRSIHATDSATPDGDDGGDSHPTGSVSLHLETNREAASRDPQDYVEQTHRASS